MKEILWITNGWLHDLGGGRTIASARIIRHLAQEGYKINVINFERKKHAYTKRNRVVRHKNILFDHRFLNSNKALIFEAINISRRKKDEIIICSGFAYIDLLILVIHYLLYRHKGKKIILYEHTFPRGSILNQSELYKYLFLIIAKLFYSRFDHIVTTNHRMKDVFVRYYGVLPRKVTVIPYPIINKNFHAKKMMDLKEKIYHYKNKKIILTAARLDLVQKDFFTLLKAFALTIDKVKNAYLVILGTGRHEIKIKEFAKKLKIYKFIYFAGYKPNPYKYMFRSDVFVLSSKFEGTGMVLVEAMASGLPIVSTDSPVGPRETLEDGKDGVLVPVGNAFAMSRAIIRILTSKNTRRKLIISGLKRARDFEFRTALNQWLTFLNKFE